MGRGTAHPRGTSSRHHELLQALPGDESNGRSLRTLEAHEWIVIERTAGGQAQALLTPRA